LPSGSLTVATIDVAHRLGNGRSARAHLGELRLDVGHVPVSHRRGHPPRPPARHQPDVLARHVEADVVVPVVLRRHAEQSGIHRRRRRQIGHGMQHGLDSLGGRAGLGHFRSSLSSFGHMANAIAPSTNASQKPRPVRPGRRTRPTTTSFPRWRLQKPTSASSFAKRREVPAFASLFACGRAWSSRSAVAS
jgi:hypothetical protein